MRTQIKVGLITSLMIAAVPTAHAQDWFVGGVLGAAKQDISVKEDGQTARYIDDKKIESQLDKPGFGGLRIGTYLNDNVRVYANLNVGGVDASKTLTGVLDGELLTVKEKYSVDNRELGFSADYLDNLFGLQNTRYFVGGTLGLNQMDVDYKAEATNHTDPGYSSAKGSKKSTALMYGVQAGVIHNFSNSFSAELGYRYAVLNNEAKFKVDDTNLKVKNGNQQVGYIALNYHF